MSFQANAIIKKGDRECPVIIRGENESDAIENAKNFAIYKNYQSNVLDTSVQIVVGVIINNDSPAWRDEYYSSKHGKIVKAN